MAIRDMDAWVKSFWDWGFLAKVLPPKVGLSDIDGVLERNGRFLFIETKGPSASMSGGQERMYRSLSQKPDCTVWVVYGLPGQPERMTWIQGGTMTEVQTSRLDLQKKVRMWWDQGTPHACFVKQSEWEKITGGKR